MNLPLQHPGLIEDEDVKTFLAAIKAGDTYSAAATKAGWSLSAMMHRMAHPRWADKFAKAKQVGAVARADKVDQRFDRWVDEDNAPAATRIAWAKRWHPAYRDRVEITGAYGGPIEVSQAERDLDLLPTAELERMLLEMRSRHQLPQPQVEDEVEGEFEPLEAA